MLKFTLPALVAGFFISAALAQEAASPPTATSDPNALICRTMAPMTGSRIGARRICLTQQQWDQSAADSRAVVERSQQNALTKDCFIPSGCQ